jgi:hypothetical protein
MTQLSSQKMQRSGAISGLDYLTKRSRSWTPYHHIFVSLAFANLVHDIPWHRLLICQVIVNTGPRTRSCNANQVLFAMVVKESGSFLTTTPLFEHAVSADLGSPDGLDVIRCFDRVFQPYPHSTKLLTIA